MLTLSRIVLFHLLLADLPCGLGRGVSAALLDNDSGEAVAGVDFDLLRLDSSGRQVGPEWRLRDSEVGYDPSRHI
jgi:hypothetical protein